MTLEQFCKKAGCITSFNPNHEGYDGPWMYQSIDSLNIRYRGYKTEEAAYKSFLECHYGKTASKAIISLLKLVAKKKAKK